MSIAALISAALVWFFQSGWPLVQKYLLKSTDEEIHDDSAKVAGAIDKARKTRGDMRDVDNLSK